MTCGKIPQNVLGTARSLEEAYAALGILKPAKDGQGAALPAPRTFLPEGTDRSAFPYLTGNDGRSFNLAPLFADNRAKYNCALSTLGYDEERAKKLSDQSKDMDEAAYAAFEKGLAPADALSFNVFKTLQVLEYMRGEGNTDRVPDVIAADEIESWAWELTGHDEKTYAKFGGDAIARLHALLGISEFLSKPEAKPEPSPAPVETSKPTFLERVRQYTQALEGRRLPSGLEGIFGDWRTFAALGGTLVAGIGLGKLLFGRGREEGAESPKPAIQKREGNAAPVVQVVVTAPVATPAQVESPRVKETEYDSLLKAMPQVIEENPSGVHTAAEIIEIDEILGGEHEITPENVIMRGGDIRPTPELSRMVVMSQIASLYPDVCNRDGSINSNFLEALQNLADHAMQQFHQLPANADGPQAADLWAREKNTHHSLVRGGLPELFLREQIEARLAQMAEVNAPGMSFSTTQRGRMQSEAERLAGDRAAFERSVQAKLLEFARAGK